MGAMQENLAILLALAGKTTDAKPVPYLTSATVSNSDYADDVEEVYRSLGGIQDAIPVGFRGWDIEVCGIGIELDEHLHFNRYRQTTLNSRPYSKLPNFPLSDYQGMCQKFEDECMRAGHFGGKWTNPSCEKQFGPAGSKRDLTGSGAPRWKQRAFYDFVKDLTRLVIEVKSVRIAIWDTVDVGGRKCLLRDVLSKRNNDAAQPIWSLIESRL